MSHRNVNESANYVSKYANEEEETSMLVKVSHGLNFLDLNVNIGPPPVKICACRLYVHMYT